MKLKIFLFVLIVCQIGHTQNSKKCANWPSITMINDVTFKESKFDRLNIGCGFLLKVKNDTFAITAKHIICVAKTDSMKTTNFENGLKQWTMYPKDKKEQTVIIDKLLNEDKTDSVTFDYIGRHDTIYNDFLVFKIKKNNSKVKPLEIRNSKLIVGEKLYVIGWSYGDVAGEQRIYEYSYLKTFGTRFNMRIIKGPVNGGGLSGSPVVDANGALVAIVSGTDEDPVTKEIYSSPRGIGYLTQFFDTYYKMK